ncbi:MAG: 4-hydroxy-tetrahydrodipicolinate reductase [Candidatus Bathyarchaeia archaeon]|nr:4-hydroxy-tetrahydrodipicolinate reductase [Candidatus Bathyarchaeota archaeon]
MKAIRICVAGADGRMGRTVIEEALNWGDIEVVGAVTAPESPNLGRRLRDLSLKPGDVEIVDPSRMEEAVKDADVYVSFTTPKAEVENLPLVARLGKGIVVGTTGLSEDQRRVVTAAVKDKVPAVISPNFSVGVNLLLKILEFSRLFPEDYDFSVLEIHHKGKMDAPSGTAKKIGDLIRDLRGYSKIVYGREGISKRGGDELEVASLRLGGITGIHEVLIAGPYELIRIEHTAFSRRIFAQGALLAVRWVYNQEKPGIYDMMDVLGV